MNFKKKVNHFLTCLLLAVVAAVVSISWNPIRAYAGGWAATVVVQYVTLDGQTLEVQNETNLTATFTFPDGTKHSATPIANLHISYHSDGTNLTKFSIFGPECYVANEEQTPAIGTYSVDKSTLTYPSGYELDDTLGVGTGTDYPLSYTVTQADVDKYLVSLKTEGGHEDYVIQVPVKKIGETSPALKAPEFDDFYLELSGVNLWAETIPYKATGLTFSFEYAASKTGTYKVLQTINDYDRSDDTERLLDLSEYSQLKVGQTYWFRARIGRPVNGTVYYGDYCTPLSIKIPNSKPDTVKLSKTSYTYDGKVKSPSVIVKNDGKAVASYMYDVVKASGCKNVGTYKYSVYFHFNYSGSLDLTFTINPKGTTISSVKSGKKSFTVKWKKQAVQTSGYQIRYSTKSSMAGAKTVTVSKNKTVSTTVKKLSAKKKYYVQVRTYKTVSGKKYYSSWSAKKTVATK